MPKAAWQRSLTILAAQLREQAALNDADETLRTDAAALREAARLLDDAEALIDAARMAPVSDRLSRVALEPWVESDLRARRRAGASDDELRNLLREPARGGLTAAQAREAVAALLSER